MEERKNVYLSLHKSFVREGIEYTDRATGEARTFNSATSTRAAARPRTP